MDLDGIFLLLLAALHWRVVLCLVGSSTLAMVLVHTFPWFTVLQGIAIAALGLAPGAAWEAERTSPKSTRSTAPETTASVATVAAVIVGATWGALSSASMHSFFAGAVIFALSAKAWSWSVIKLKYNVTKERVFFSIAIAMFAYPIAAMVAHSAL